MPTRATVQPPAPTSVEPPGPQRDVAKRRTPAYGGMQRPYDVPSPGPRRHRAWYLTTRARFLVAFMAATAWMGFSVWISLPWIHDLAQVISLVPAVAVIALIAFLPGHLIAFLAAGVLLDRQPRFTITHPTTALTVLIAARNEAPVIGETLDYLATQDYGGPLHVLLIDNGSGDGTADVARQAAARTGLALSVVYEPRQGKSHALNHGLAAAQTSLLVTVDADTLLHRSAIRLLVARLESSPRDVVAVAGDVMVRNSRSTIWSRLQMWDYLLGIAAVKRVQGFFQGTLVAQGAFSLYRTDAVRAAGGWPDAIGEDIVLTWQLLRAGRVFYEPMALAFTSAPDGLHALTKQRSRWARGMLEGIRAVPPWRQPRGIARALTSIDLAIPFLDVAYVFAWLPGLVLAGFGRYWIVGPMTVTVLPVTLFVYWLLYRFQRRQVLEPLGLVARRDHGGFLLFLLGYQALMSTMSVLGYAQQLLHRRRNWK